MNARTSSLLGLGCDCQQKPAALGSYGKPIEWNTEPVINTYSWNRDGYWDCNDWMTWHSKVKAKYGQARANEVFMIWWNKQGTLAYAQDCYVVNQTFRTWWKQQGLPSEGLLEFMLKPFDFITGAQGKVLDAAGNVISDAADSASNAGDLASSLTKLLSKAIPIAVGAIAIGGGYYLYKHYIKGDEKIKTPKASLGAIKQRKVIHV